MVAMHAYLKNRLPYPHMQQYAPGVTATVLERNVVQFTKTDDNVVHVSITTKDEAVASKILSWAPIEGPGAVEAELLRSYLLYPGLTLTESEEHLLVKDYIRHYYEVAFSRYMKNRTSEPIVYLHSVGMMLSIDPNLTRSITAGGAMGTVEPPPVYVTIMNTLSSNTKFFRIYVKDTKQEIMLENYADWAFVRIMAHAILKYAWTHNYEALADLLPRGIFRTSRGAKPSVNGVPIESSVYNDFNGTMVSTNVWHNDSVRDAFVVDGGTDATKSTAIWYDDRGRRFRLVLTKSRINDDDDNDDPAIARESDDVPSVVWVYDGKDEPERMVSCGGAEIIELVGALTSTSIRSTFIDREQQQQYQQQQETHAVTTTAAQVDEAEFMQGDDSRNLQYLSYDGDALILRHEWQWNLVEDYERALFRRAATLLASLESTVTPNTYRVEFTHTRELVYSERAEGTIYGDTIWIARVGYLIIQGLVLTSGPNTEMIRQAYEALQKAVLRINQHENASAAATGSRSRRKRDASNPDDNKSQDDNSQNVFDEGDNNRNNRDNEKAIEEEEESSSGPMLCAAALGGLATLGAAIYFYNQGIGGGSVVSGGGGSGGGGGGGGKMLSSRHMSVARMNPLARHR